MLRACLWLPKRQCKHVVHVVLIDLFLEAFELFLVITEQWQLLRPAVESIAFKITSDTGGQLRASRGRLFVCLCVLFALYLCVYLL